MRLSLRDSVELHLDYDDRTPFGALVSGELEARLKRRFRPLAEALQRGTRDVVERGPSILAELFGAHSAGDLFSAPGVLRDEVVHPAPSAARPTALRVGRRGTEPARVDLAPGVASDLASWLGDWQRDATAPASGPARDLWNALSDLGCFAPARAPSAVRGAATFIGHATVLLSGPRTKILVDPFLLPRSTAFPAGYQPLTHGDIEPDAVLVTHSHRDHFHPGSLLRLGKDTPIIVPDVPRESALSAGMAERLRELGFTRVQTLRWHEETAVGDFRVVALPFYGEQPTTEDVACPDVRNAGNTYLVEGEGHRYAFVADAGRDRLGDVRSVATAAFEQYGAIDVLFGGYRSWSLYPVQYALTSVPQYLLFTPKALWGARQQIMNDAHALLDTAERWHARHVVPYADGGAPWHWELGLGPRLDAAGGQGNVHFDPHPEAVIRAAAARSTDGSRMLSSAVGALLMRPGDSLEFDARGAAVVVPNDGHVWPYAQGSALATTAGAMSEPLGLTRKRVLLRMLAGEEMKRRHLTVSAEQVREMSDDLRRQNGLVDHAAMVAWLERAGLTMAEYCEIIVDWQGVIQLEDALADAIEKRVAGQRAFASMRTARQT
jgi:L-ascorbate metabolism protein UlaG (beta-lactamase superfamily)